MLAIICWFILAAVVPTLIVTIIRIIERHRDAKRAAYVKLTAERIRWNIHKEAILKEKLNR